MNYILLINNKLNLGQTPVIEADKPLYTNVKKLQKLVKISSLLCLVLCTQEKMLWSVSGDWLECSGWTTVVLLSQIVALLQVVQLILSFPHPIFIKQRYIYIYIYAYLFSGSYLPSGKKSIQTI